MHLSINHLLESHNMAHTNKQNILSVITIMIKCFSKPENCWSLLFEKLVWYDWSEVSSLNGLQVKYTEKSMASTNRRRSRYVVPTTGESSELM